ncbi:MAG: hypothetical protein QMD61_05060 [Methanobacterium sp.]|nr:hypothetical protein [Methanobacterium sp.]
MEDKQKQLYKKPKIEIYGNLKKITNKTEGPPDGYNTFGTS